MSVVMEAISKFSDTYYDGYAVRDFLVRNVDLSLYIAGGYLFFVFYGPAVIEKYHLTMGKMNEKTGIREKSPIIKYSWILWNFFLSFFSLYGTLHVTPYVVNQVRTLGWRGALCTLDSATFYQGKVGMAVGLFCLSKGPEFLDTFFIIISGKKNLPFLQWFHHVTTFLFAWHAYAVGSSALYFAAALNYTVHVIMYFYFALSELGFKKVVRPFAVYITTIQILQMIFGTLWISMIISYKLTDLVKGSPDSCSGTPWDVARVQFFIAFANFCLFTHMFLGAYVLKKKKPEVKSAGKQKE